MRNVTIRPGKSITIGDTVITAEYSDLKSEKSKVPVSEEHRLAGGRVG